MTTRSEKLCKCHGCGKPTPFDLIDAKDDGTGNYTVLLCKDCYGDGWLPAMRPVFILCWSSDGGGSRTFYTEAERDAYYRECILSYAREEDREKYAHITDNAELYEKLAIQYRRLDDVAFWTAEST